MSAGLIAGLGLAGGALAWFAWVKRGLDWQPPATRRLDLPLATRVVGEGQNAIVLLHGLAGSGRYFGATYDTLARPGWRVVVPDLLGFGASKDLGVNYDIQEHVEAIDATLKALSIDGDVILVGHSTGCVLALALAPGQRTRGVVNIAPVIYRSAQEAHVHLSAMGALVHHFALKTALAERLCGWMCRHRKIASWLAVFIRADLPVPVARDGVQHTWRSYSQTLEHVVIQSRSAQLAQAFAAPLHLIAGEDDAAMATQTLAQLARMGHACLHMLPGGHDLPMRQSKRCLAVIQCVANDERNDAPG